MNASTLLRFLNIGQGEPFFVIERKRGSPLMQLPAQPKVNVEQELRGECQ